MNSVWYRLFWKEFREHFWRAVALTAVLVALPVWMMFDEPAGTYYAVTLVLMFYTPLAAVFLAMGIAAGERSSGTVAFIGALPVSLWKLAAAKLLAAFAALMVPVVILLSLVWLWQLAWPLIGITELDMVTRDIGPFWELAGEDGWYLAIAASAALGGGSLLICAAAFGCNFADEIRAAAVALGGIALWWGGMFLANWIGLSVPVQVPGGWNETIQMMVYVPPGSPTGYPDLLLDVIRSPRVPASVDRIVFAIFTLSLFVHVALVGSFLRRFGRSLPSAPPRTKQRLSMAPVMLLPAPRRSKLSAIVWKQFRETGPLALIALVSVTGVAWCMAAYDTRRDDFDRQLSTNLFVVATIVGIFVVTATGVGLFESDLKPRLHAFWRSRPIHPGLWFWTKLLTGLALVSAAIYLPVGYGIWSRGFPFYDWDALLTILLLHGLAFTSAVMAICLLRQPFYAAILSIGASVSIAVLLDDKVSSDAWRIACHAALIVLTIAIAWAAVRWNIGVGRSRIR